MSYRVNRTAVLISRGGIVGAAVFCLTFIAFHLHVNKSSAGFLYLLLVVIIALRLGFGAATVASFLAVNCLDYYFIAPILTFRISDPGDWTALLTFEFTALVVSRLSTQVQHQARIAKQQSSARQKLYQLSRGALLLDPARPVESQILGLIQATLRIKSAALFDAAHARTYSAGEMAAELESTARNTYLLNRDEDDAVGGQWSRVLGLGGKAMGAIALLSDDLVPEVVDAVTWECGD
jgi:two-component system sensor histidine kinase KdpD